MISTNQRIHETVESYLDDAQSVKEKIEQYQDAINEKIRELEILIYLANKEADNLEEESYDYLEVSYDVHGLRSELDAILDSVNA
jgi:hypothetical protein